MFSSHCNAGSKTAWLIVPGPFHVVRSARKSGSGKWLLCALEPEERELSESTVLITTRRSSPSVAIQLWPPGEGRCDLCWVGSRSTFVSSFVWLSCIEGFPGTTPNHSLSLEGFDRIIHCFIATQQCTVCPLKHSYFPSFFFPPRPLHAIATTQYC